jgi:hypothetical protein
MLCNNLGRCEALLSACIPQPVSSNVFFLGARRFGPFMVAALERDLGCYMAAGDLQHLLEVESRLHNLCLLRLQSVAKRSSRPCESKSPLSNFLEALSGAHFVFGCVVVGARRGLDGRLWDGFYAAGAGHLITLRAFQLSNFIALATTPSHHHPCTAIWYLLIATVTTVLFFV